MAKWKKQEGKEQESDKAPTEKKHTPEETLIPPVGSEWYASSSKDPWMNRKDEYEGRGGGGAGADETDGSNNSGNIRIYDYFYAYTTHIGPFSTGPYTLYNAHTRCTLHTAYTSACLLPYIPYISYIPYIPYIP